MFGFQLKAEEIEDKEAKKKQAHLFAKLPTVEQVKKRIAMWDKKIATQTLNLKNKNVSAFTLHFVSISSFLG